MSFKINPRLPQTTESPAREKSAVHTGSSYPPSSSHTDDYDKAVRSLEIQSKTLELFAAIQRQTREMKEEPDVIKRDALTKRFSLSDTYLGVLEFTRSERQLGLPPSGCIDHLVKKITEFER